MAVHFKFRSAVEYDSVSLDGTCISIANLKEKIVEQKNLGRGTDFDLVITSAETGEEYTEDSFLVPENTSVIIKRVPATRAKPTLLVPDPSTAEASQQTSGPDSRDADATLPPVATSIGELYDLDDFGVDLYAFDKAASQHVEADEDSEISATMTRTVSDWNRYTEETFPGGQGYGRGVLGRGHVRGHGIVRPVPPAGYVCHRCGQPGHFIQHCPTNGDPAYDMKMVNFPVGITRSRLNGDQEGSYILPDGSATIVQADDVDFMEEVDAQLLIRPAQMDLPPELQCSLCQEIFKEAVMIPCCHHSFCDKCIRQALIEKGKCPQCESTKFKDEDVLPNIALRQAIDRFRNAQLCTTADEGASKQQQQVPDVESATRKVSSPAALGVKLELPKSSAANINPSLVIIKKTRLDPPLIADSVCESAIGPKEETVVDDSKHCVEAGNASIGIDCVHKSDESEGPTSKVSVDVPNHPIMKAVSRFVKEAKQHVNDIGESAITVSKSSELPSYKEAEGVALESEVSKGKKKKKWNCAMPTDGVVEHILTGKSRKMDRYCYICGSAEHLARDCHGNAVDNPVPYPPRRGMFHPVGPIGPATVPPYGQEMYWHGPSIPHVRAFPLGYGEAMYGPCPVALPFERPIIPISPFGVASYMPPMYSGLPLHSGFMKAMRPGLMVPMDRPLSREEFIELQERERRRRLIQERQERDYSDDKADSRDGVGHSLSADLKHGTQQHCLSDDGYEVPSSKHDFDKNSVRKYSDDPDHQKKISRNRRHTSERLAENSFCYQPERVSDGYMALDCSKSHGSRSGKRQQKLKDLSSETRRELRYHRQASDEWESCDEEDDGQHSFSVRGCEKMLREGEYARLSRQSNSARYDALYFEKYESSSSKKFDENIVFCGELGSGEGSHVSRHRSKRIASEGSKYASQSERSTSHVEHCFEGAGGMEESYHVHGSPNDDVDSLKKEETLNRKKHHHSKCRSDTDVMNHESEDESKKRRRHRKHHSEGTRHVAADEIGVLNHKKHKANRTLQESDKHTSAIPQLEASPAQDDLEEGRWQMDCGMDRKDDGCSSYRDRSSINSPFL